MYQTPSGAIELRGDVTRDTIWATLYQIAEIFGRDKSVISRHLTNIFKEGELRRDSVVAKIATTATDGKAYQVDYYNLDAIFSDTAFKVSNFPRKTHETVVKLVYVVMIRIFYLGIFPVLSKYEK